MTLADVAMSIHECATGANGVMTDAEIIDRAASELVDIVYETLVGDYGVEFSGARQIADMKAIRRLVARAMLRQHQHDEELNNAAMAAA